MLADSIWPRSGCDRRNSSKARVAGPTAARIALRVSLPQAKQPIPERAYKHGGIVVSPDGTLRVAKAGVVSALSIKGEILWSLELPEDKALPNCHSAPVALQNGDAIIALRHTCVIIDAKGQIIERIKNRHGFMDEEMSPNVMLDGSLIATSIMGNVSILAGRRWKTVGYFGYDIVPPAIYDDGSLAIAGYYGSGFCRVKPSGQFVWKTDLYKADLLPVLNSRQVAAVGSMNDKLSAFFTPEGQKIGEYPRAALFTEHLDETWVALSADYIARLTLDGGEIWEHEVATRERWSRAQPVVDQAGRIYIAATNAIICFDAAGSVVFTIPTGEAVLLGLSIIAEGKLACIIGEELVIIA